MDLSQKQQAHLKKIVTEDAFDTLQQVASAMLANWNKNPIDDETEWTTARDCIKRDARKLALVSFLETIEKLCHDK